MLLSNLLWGKNFTGVVCSDALESSGGVRCILQVLKLGGR